MGSPHLLTYRRFKPKGCSMKQHIKSPEEKRLDIFVGRWNNTGHVMPGPFGPGGEIIGTTSYKWALGDKWLQYTSRLELPGMGKYEVQGGVVHNNRTGKYDAYAVNNLGTLMVYEGEWLDETTLVFLLTYPTPAGRARIVYRTLPNSSIQMNSDRLAKNGKFETYFETEMVQEEKI
jgi:hypothetical protein